MELRQLVEMMVNDGSFTRIINNPLAQFGGQQRNYLGATILPEQSVPQNVFKEEFIEFRSNIANAGTRYSPPQLKGNSLIGAMTVELAESDIAAEFTAQDYDALVRILERLGPVNDLSQVPPQAMVTMVNWYQQMILRPLLEFNEKLRWDSIVSSSVSLTGDNGFSETLSYYNPSGHRVAAGGQWSNNNYDPYLDIIAGYRQLQKKGYMVSRMVTSLDVVLILLSNTKIQQRLGFTSIVSGNVVGLPGMASLDTLNQRLAKDGLPPIECYDLQYRTQTGTAYFLSRSVFVMLATTGRDMEYDRGDAQPFMLPNTLGYTAIGRPANRNEPGRATVVEYNDKKGSPIKGQGWQTSLPVIMNPEGIYVVNTIS
jgi:hypothetical protein